MRSILQRYIVRKFELWSSAKRTELLNRMQGCSQFHCQGKLWEWMIIILNPFYPSTELYIEHWKQKRPPNWYYSKWFCDYRFRHEGQFFLSFKKKRDCGQIDCCRWRCRPIAQYCSSGPLWQVLHCTYIYPFWQYRTLKYDLDYSEPKSCSSKFGIRLDWRRNMFLYSDRQWPTTLG